MIYEKEMRKNNDYVTIFPQLMPIQHPGQPGVGCLGWELWETQDDLFVSLLHNLFLCTKFCFGL